MKFQWYIISLDNATVKGSNDVEEVQHLLTDPMYIVLTGQHGVYFNGSTDQVEVLPLKENSDAEDSDEDDDEDGDDSDLGDDDTPEDRENESGTPADEDEDPKSWED